MSEFINQLREKLIVYNLSENYVFYVDENRINYEFTPQLPQEPYTLAWVRFNFSGSHSFKRDKILQTRTIETQLDIT